MDTQNNLGTSATIFDVLEKEERIMRFLFDNPEIQDIVAPYVIDDYFSDQNIKLLAGNIQYWLNKYQEFPHVRELYSRLKDNSPVKPLLHKIMTTPVGAPNSKSIMDECENFFRGKMLVNGLQDQIEVIQEGDIDKVRAAVDGMRDKIDFKLDVDVGTDLERQPEIVIRRMQEMAGAIPSSLSAINQLTSARVTGGWYRKALSIYLGQANVGKTLFMCNEAAYAYVHGYNVLFITLELSEEKIAQRIYANICDIVYKDVEAESTDDETVINHAKMIKKKMGDAKQFAEKGHVQVKYLPSGSRPADVERILKEVQRVKGIKIDLLIVDYIGEMGANKARGGDKRHEELGAVARQLRNIAAAHGVAILTGSQINRDGYGTTDVSMKNTSDSAQLNHVADVMFSITQDENLKKYNLCAHKVIKNRHGPKDDVFYSRLVWDYMRALDATDSDIARAMSEDISKPSPPSGFNKAA